LKLPLLLAVHLALNKPDTPLDSFQERSDSQPPQVLMGVIGEAGSGKSALVAAMSVRRFSGVGFFSLDAFSKKTWITYLEYFNSQESINPLQRMKS
jgi:ABC-type phosphonate transport system ATPase subunit